MKYIFNFLMLCLFLTAVSCEKSLSEVNDDLNNVSTAKDQNVLTAAQGYLAYNLDYELNGRVSPLWGQYYTWGVGVSIGNQERFVAQPADFNNYWNRTYSNALTDMKVISDSEDLRFSGMGKLLQAYTYQGLVDHFGDVPFSTAISGATEDGANLTPSFDDAATIYTGLIALVDEGISDLNKNTNSASVGGADLMYGGDISKWIKFGNSLKLRLLMRQSETNPQGAAVTALINGGNFISSQADIAKINFNGDNGNENPMYARFTFGVGDFYFVSNASLDVLASTGDPRDTFFYSRASVGPFANSLRGINQGSVDDDVEFTADPEEYSGSSDFVYSSDQPVFLMSNWEVDFLRAEAALRYGTSDDATAMFERAIQASCDYYGAGGCPAFIAGLDFAGAAGLDAKLDLIGTQKWVSMNGTQEDEGWTEARRFDRPDSRLFTGAGGIWQDPYLSVLPDRTFPSAWLYPSDERSLNPNAPAQRVLTDRIFWDN